jgi:hypothetical protein
LAFFLASVHLEVFQNEKKNRPSIHAMVQIKKMNTQKENGHFVVCIRVSEQQNTIFTKRMHKCIILG